MTVFKTMDDLDAYFYGPNAEEIMKEDFPLTTGTAGVYNRIYGRRIWLQLNTELNAFAIIPKEPWTYSGFRVFKSYLDPANGIGETGTIPGSADVDARFAQINGVIPKTLVHVFEVSDILEELAARGDDIIGEPLNALKEIFGLQHIRDMNVHLTTKVEAVNSVNPDSLDHIISSYSESTITGIGAKADIYGINRSDSVNHEPWADAIVLHNNGTLRTLELQLLDAAFQQVLAAGGMPKVILTGYDTVMAISQLLETSRRYVMPTARIQPTYNGVTGIEGTEGGFIVATYNGIPIIPSQHVQKDGAGSLSRIYFLDTDYLAFRVLRPTGYFEAGIRTGDPFVINKFTQKGLYRTVGELICRRFNVMAKIRDIQ